MAVLKRSVTRRFVSNLRLELVWRNTGNNPDPSLLRGYAKVEPMSISKLNEFIIAAEPQEIECVRTGRVTGIKMDKGWCYVSFSRCARSSTN
ncbi:unnamed protein product [Brassica oleracea]